MIRAAGVLRFFNSAGRVMSIPVPSPDDSRQSPTEVEQTSADAHLLEQVLKETIAAAHQVSSDGAALEVLLQVARRHPGHALTREPVMVDLVQSLLKDRFSSLSDNVELWRDMSFQIADTLLEDSVTHNRLQDLWSQATGAE